MSIKTVACIIARTVSTRLPLKVLRNVVSDFSMLDFIIQRLKQVKNIDEIYLCTSIESVDDILSDVAKKNKIKMYRGSADAVIERLISVGEKECADNIIRVTGDNVFTSVEYIDEQISVHNNNGLDYTRVMDVPIGASAEIMKLTALKKCYDLIDPSISEYLLLYMFEPRQFKCGVLTIKDFKKSSDYSVTVDTPEDLVRTKTIFELYGNNPLQIKLKDIIDIIDSNNIENSKFKLSGNVKMPYGKEISFEEFQEDMNRRRKQSTHYSLG
jgi:spore coat polysaccharide biosynthesis protein SpsF